jgi:hypothetical protein
MTEKELKIWFWNKYNSCYPLICDDYIYMIYDKNFHRQMKLSRVLNTPLVYPKKHDGICLFKEDYLNQNLYCDDEIWSVIEKNFSNYRLTQAFIKTLLCDKIRTRTLTSAYLNSDTNLERKKLR